MWILCGQGFPVLSSAWLMLVNADMARCNYAEKSIWLRRAGFQLAPSEENPGADQVDK